MDSQRMHRERHGLQQHFSRCLPRCWTTIHTAFGAHLVLQGVTYTDEATVAAEEPSQPLSDAARVIVVLLCPVQTLLEGVVLRSGGLPHNAMRQRLKRATTLNPIPIANQLGKIEFYDHNGVYRAIRVPEGTLETALELFEKEDWERLVEFRAWREVSTISCSNI
jgi:hypothetical protein